MRPYQFAVKIYKKEIRDRNAQRLRGGSNSTSQRRMNCLGTLSVLWVNWRAWSGKLTELVLYVQPTFLKIPHLGTRSRGLRGEEGTYTIVLSVPSLRKPMHSHRRNVTGLIRSKRSDHWWAEKNTTTRRQRGVNTVTSGASVDKLVAPR